MLPSTPPRLSEDGKDDEQSLEDAEKGIDLRPYFADCADTLQGNLNQSVALAVDDQ